MMQQNQNSRGDVITKVLIQRAMARDLEFKPLVVIQRLRVKLRDTIRRFNCGELGYYRNPQNLTNLNYIFDRVNNIYQIRLESLSKEKERR